MQKDEETFKKDDEMLENDRKLVLPHTKEANKLWKIEF